MLLGSGSTCELRVANVNHESANCAAVWSIASEKQCSSAGVHGLIRPTLTLKGNEILSFVQ